jgi:predicted TIM-barrel enzyme
LASALIVTGPGTGHPARLDDLRAVRAAAPDTPLYVGSGANPDSLASLLAVADGVIIGTAAKADGVVGNPVALERARTIVAAAHQVSGR